MITELFMIWYLAYIIFHADNVGKQISLGQITYAPPRNGPTLWEIGTPDRTAAEFFVPDPRPEYINPVFLNSEKNKYIIIFFT